MIPVIAQFSSRFQVEDVDAGHWLISEQPAEFLRIVREFTDDEKEV